MGTKDTVRALLDRLPDDTKERLAERRRNLSSARPAFEIVDELTRSITERNPAAASHVDETVKRSCGQDE